jgi:RNA polymerase sigma-70 factor (ECF subfamily)
MIPGTQPREPGFDDDLRLIDQVLAGDRAHFETLVRRHERRVFRVALAVLGNFEDAEEAMQDAFVKAYRHLKDFRRESRFSTWLTRIAVNEALQKRQARKKRVTLDEAREIESSSLPRNFEPWSADPERQYGRKEVRQIVEKAMQSLPEIYREALVLRDFEGMSAEEAATALEITVPALKSRLLRARLMMREALSASFEARRPVGMRISDTVAEMRNMVAMVLMRAAGR